MISKPILAQRMHEAKWEFDSAEHALTEVVLAVCGNLANAYDVEEYHTDGYDNSIEVWYIGDIDLDEAARKLWAEGFERVWLHQHPRSGNCACPCRRSAANASGQA